MAVLPEASVTVHVTVVFPIGNAAGALLATVDPVQLSAKVGVPNGTAVAVQLPASVFTVTAAGGVMVGDVVSVSVPTVKLAVPVAPVLSVKITVWLPAARLLMVTGETALAVVLPMVYV